MMNPTPGALSLCALVLATLAGCGDPVEACTDNTECRDAFGFGSVCGDAGYCAVVDLPARCATYPTDLIGGDYDDPIVLGSLYDAAWDIAEMQSVRLVFKQADESGGLEGRQLALLECSYEEDHEGDGLDYTAAVGFVAETLVQDFGIAGFVGPYTSSETESAWNAIADETAQAFLISPSATSPALTYLDGLTKTDEAPGLLWRTAPPDSLQGKVAAEDMLNRTDHGGLEDVTNVAVIFEADAYGRGLAEIFQAEFSAGGGTATMYEFSNDTVLSEHVVAVKNNSAAQEVFFISAETPTIANFLKSAHQVGGYENKGIFLSDAAADTDMLADAASASVLFDQIRGTRPAVPQGVLYDTFAASYRSEYDEDPYATIYMPYAYDAAWLAAYAAAWSLYQEGEVTPVGMGRGMRKISAGDALDIKASSWNSLKAHFGEGEGVDVAGTTGSLDYDPATEETTAPIEVWVVNGAGDNFDVDYTIEP